MPVCLHLRTGNGMENESDREPGRIVPANDNDDASSLPDAATLQRIDHAALTLARIIGRRLAREDFERLHAANDNRPVVSEKTEDGADKE